MSNDVNPKIITNGLLLHYDMSNSKSYRSPPLRNVLNQITPRSLGAVGSAYIFTAGKENVYIPTIGWVDDCDYVDMFNDSSQSCCPSPYGYGDGLTVLPSTEYTYAIVYKSVNGYTHPNFMYHYEFTSGGSYLTEYGVFYNGSYSGQIRHLGDDWYWASAKFTTNASAGLMNTGSWMYEYNRFNRFYVARIMIVQGDYTNLHPRFWPALGTTISNTQTITDLTRNNTITATSLTYANDGTFSFNGSSNYIDVTNNLGVMSAYTISFWARRDAENRMPVAGRTNTAFYWYGDNSWAYTHGGTWGEYYYSKPTSIPLGTWGHYCVVYNGFNVSIYRQGIFQGSQATTGAADWSQGLRIGFWAGGSGYAWQGRIDSVSMYNRALTADEVSSNFSALRGEYGV